MIKHVNLSFYFHAADSAIEVQISIHYGDVVSMFKDVSSDLQLMMLKNDLRLSETVSNRPINSM